MDAQFDINKITAEVISQTLSGIASSLKGEVKNSWQSNFGSFKKYIRNSRKKYELTKTLLYKDKAVKLTSIYVGTRFSNPAKDSELGDTELVAKLNAGEKLIVSATAGAGKSFFAKYCYLALLSSGKRVPVMVELRHLNDSELGIVEFIADELKESGVVADLAVVKTWIKNGTFVIILDGFDELSSRSIKRLKGELKRLHSNTTKSAIMITTRPSDDIEYFGDLNIYRIKQLNKKQAIALISKVDFDEKTKSAFLIKLEKGLFKKHQDFLSNPLLLTIMLMTYGETAEIPSKMHVFYEQAFDVLFFRHDASKGLYRRKMHSGLAIDDFRQILACISASGYVRSRISYSNNELLQYIRKAKQTTGIRNFSPEKYKRDLLQSVCMFVNDGQSFAYNHRSFQEYFAAIFLVTISSDQKMTLYERYLERGPWENALYLAFEINQSVLEREFVLPFVNIYKKHSDKGIWPALEAIMRGFVFEWYGDEKHGVPHYGMLHSTLLFSFWIFAERAYRNIAGANAPRLRRTLTKKAFLAELGHDCKNKEIVFKGISVDERKMLERLGITKHARKQIDFIDWLHSYLVTRQSRIRSSNLESWL